MRRFMRFLPLLGMVFAVATAEDCVGSPSSDKLQQNQQEVILKDLTAQTGMPAVKNGRERRELKDIIELRDQASYTTYTYTFSEVTGKPTLFCNSIGYPLPYATQYTNPEKNTNNGYAYITLPQADPNGLFSPSSADGTWVMCVSPGGKAVPVYIEPKVITSPYKLEP